MYLVNDSSKHEPVKRVYKTREKSQSLLDHPRILHGCFRNVLLLARSPMIHIFSSISLLFSDVYLQCTSQARV